MSKIRTDEKVKITDKWLYNAITSLRENKHISRQYTPRFILTKNRVNKLLQNSKLTTNKI